MTRVIVTASRKGGVGKTTMVANLAAAGVSEKLTVATIDLDTQGTLSRFALGRARLDRLTPDETVRKLTRVNSSAERPAWCHPMASIPGAFIVPVTPAVRLDDVEQLDVIGLADLVVIDTPPDVGSSVVRAAICAATDIVLPVAPELWCLESIPEVFGALRDAGRDDLIERTTIVLNAASKNATHNALETIVRKLYGRQVSDVVIPRAVAFAESALKSTTVGLKTANGKAFVSLLRSITSKPVRRAA